MAPRTIADVDEIFFSKFRGPKADQGKINNLPCVRGGPTTLIWIRTEVKIVLWKPGYIESYLLSFSRHPEKNGTLKRAETELISGF